MRILTGGALWANPSDTPPAETRFDMNIFAHFHARIAALLQAIWPGIETALTDGAMVTVTDRSIRVRRLPIVRR